MNSLTRLLGGLTIALCAGLAQAAPITAENDPALNGSTLINFESVATGEYALLDLNGVDIQGVGGTMTICDGCGGGGGAYGDQGRSLQNTGGSPTSFNLIFDDVVSAFGLIGGAYNNGWTYTAYDSFNNVLETLQVNSPCCGGFFQGIAQQGIKRVNLSGYGDWVVFDNLRFVAQTSDVPEPGSLLLLGLGLISLVLSRKRLQNRQ